MISVIMPVYNAELYLKKSIYSILNQSYKNFEFLILDDNSNDNSKKIIKSFSEIDNRIKVFEQKTNIGVTNALNFLIKKLNIIILQEWMLTIFLMQIDFQNN